MRLGRFAALLVCSSVAVGIGARVIAAQDPVARAEEPGVLVEQAAKLGSERRFTEGVALARQAADIYATAAPNTVERANALRLLGNLQYEGQQFRDAADTFTIEAQVREQLTPADPAGAARTLNDLANTRRRLGQLVEAKDLLERALGLQRRSLPGDDFRIGETAINLASLQSAMGDRPGAEANFRLALQIFDSRDEATLENAALRTKAALLNNLAQMYFRDGEFANAVNPLRRSIALRERLSSNPAVDPAVLLAYGNLATVYQDLGDLKEAAPLYERVLEGYAKIPNVPQTNMASALVNLAMIRLLQGDLPAAEPLYRRALEIRESILGPRHVDVAGTYERLAVFEQVSNRPRDAYRAMERSTSIHEDNLRTILMSGSDQQRQAYMTTVQENLDIALSLRAAIFEQQADASAWAATLVMRRKGRVLDAATTMTERLVSRMTADERQLFDKLAAARTQLAALVLQSTDAPAGQRDEARRTLEAEIDQVESALAARSREFAAELRAIDVEAVRAQLPDRTVLVEYVRYRPFNPTAIGRNNRFGEPRYAAFVTSRDRAPRWFELGAAAPIERGIRSLRDMLRVPSSPARSQTRGLQTAAAAGVRTAGRDLGRLLLDPMQAELADAERILFAPDGELSVIPFAALQMSTARPGTAANQFLIERAEIGYLASGRDLVSRAERSAAAEAPLIVAAPTFDGTPAGGTTTFAPLAGTAEEAEALRGLIAGARVLTGAAATERAIKTVRGPRVLHVATHGFFLNAASATTGSAGERGGIALAAVDAQSVGRQALLRSGLALAGANQRQGGDGEDGLLTALEAASLDLRGTQLVVLSACDTGLGEIRSGDGVYGLRRALAIAGAESQVMSLWQVSDRATRDLMIAYYTQLSRGAGRAAALRAVQLQLLKSREWAHPYYWAAFVVAGAWEPLRQSVASQAPPARFDVASVKPNRSGDTGVRWTFENGRFTATNVTLRMLLATAYGTPQQPLPDFQMTGGPNWIGTERFDVVAHVADSQGSPLSSLLRPLVEDRFGVRTHTDRRELPIYALVLARKDGVLGPKLRRSTIDCAAVAAGRIPGERCGGEIVPGRVVARGITPTQIVSGLARLMPNVGRPVIDRTGLTGAFDIELTWTPDQTTLNAMPGMPMPPVDPNGPSLFTALQEQLGLKLDSQRGPVDILVIDAAELPQGD